MDDRTEIAARVMAALLETGDYTAEGAADEAVERTDALLEALADTDEGVDDNDPIYDQFLPSGHRWLDVGEDIKPGDRAVRRNFNDEAHLRWPGEKCQVEKFICRKIEEPSRDSYLPAGYRWLEVGEAIKPGDRVVRDNLNEDAYGKWSLREVYFPQLICRKVDETPSPAVEEPPVAPVDEPGYRNLVAGEVIQNGDEFFYPSLGGWRPSGDAGRTVGNGITEFKYRRKVEEPGYRTLAVGEVIEIGDEFFCTGTKTWFKTGDAGRAVCDDPKELKYRRKVGPSGEVVLDRKLQLAKERGVEPGEGYRLLTSNELLLPTDEFWFNSGKSWQKTFSADGRRFAGWSKDIYRRAVEVVIPAAKPVDYGPGEGYRWLNEGETIGSEDGYRMSPREGFFPVAAAWVGCGAVVGNFIRRKVEATGPAGVVKVPPAFPFPGNYAQIKWNTCCRAHREALDKAGVKWQIDLESHWLSMAEEAK